MAAPPDGLQATQEFLGGLLRQCESLAEAEGGVRAEIRRVVAGNDRLSPEQQADIYREQFWLRHRDSLYEDFPALAKLVGEDVFDALARDYLAAHPPRSWTLRDLGEDLADFADGWRGFGEHAAAARDLCRYELAFVALFDAAAVAPVALAKVEAVPAEAWEGARIGLHPALTLLELGHPVHAYRLAVKNGEEPAALAAAPTCLAMWQGEDLRVHHRELEANELGLLLALRRGMALGPACEEVARGGDVSGSVGGWFASWAKSGWVVDITV